MTLHIDIHVLQSVPPSNLNRDDTGSPKTATYGGVFGLPVSSRLRLLGGTDCST